MTASQLAQLVGRSTVGDGRSVLTEASEELLMPGCSAENKSGQSVKVEERGEREGESAILADVKQSVQRHCCRLASLQPSTAAPHPAPMSAHVLSLSLNEERGDGRKTGGKEINVAGGGGGGAGTINDR